ncbi:nucleoid-associated protein [Arcobacter roscoffensis]|uniref:Nucleoid-associated protein n=1 Tax=Arcobacter roscoffensis TaxID=2961520 RepID=A0ABY5E1Z6_9BACT|nr:nucleoid-associated protein [Arcobacter roscoffensis]UTJ06211.1 nucleoid-associated protein [Arcobacter roscoffensis]
MPLHEFTNLNIDRIITHEIFQRNEQREIVTPNISTALTNLDDDGKEELATRIIEAVGKDSKSIEMDIENKEDNSVYSHIKSILENNSQNNFIEKSANIANNLARAQTARNLPGGIVVVIDGVTSLDENKYVAIIKAELQGGFQKSNNNTITYVRDLLLTPQQKLYKIGIFMESETNNDLRAFVYDFNMSRSEENGMALYFYDRFLGCKISHTDKYLTSKFYHEAKKFIDNNFDEEDTLDMHTHLYSYLKSESATINVTEFADQYIAEDIKRNEFNNHLQNVVGKEDFNRTITKDITDIKSKLRIRKVTFSNKVKISAPSEAFDENVQIIDEFERDNKFITSIEIAGKISGLDK